MGGVCSTHRRDERSAYKISVGNLKGGDHSGDLGVDGKIILEWILGTLGGKMWVAFIWLRRGSVRGPCDHVNKRRGIS